MGERKFEAGLVNMLLTFVSAWSCLQCQSLWYASLGFVLYTAVGIAGTIKFLVDKEDLKRAHNAVLRWSRPLYYPLVTVQALLHHGVLDSRLSLALLVPPLVYLVLSELLDKNVSKDLLNLNTVVCSGALCYIAYKLHDVVAAVCALLGFLAFFRGSGSLSRNLNHKLLVILVDLAVVHFFTASLAFLQNALRNFFK